MKIKSFHPIPSKPSHDAHDQPSRIGHIHPERFDETKSWRQKTINEWQQAMAKVLRAYNAVNGWLLSCYQLSGRTGLDLPSAEARTVSLRSDEVICLTTDSCVRYIEVKRGTVWLTGTSAKGDVLLQEGDRFRLNDDWPFVVQALGEARIVLLP